MSDGPAKTCKILLGKNKEAINKKKKRYIILNKISAVSGRNWQMASGIVTLPSFKKYEYMPTQRSLRGSCIHSCRNWTQPKRRSIAEWCVLHIGSCSAMKGNARLAHDIMNEPQKRYTEWKKSNTDATCYIILFTWPSGKGKTLKAF